MAAAEAFGVRGSGDQGGAAARLRVMCSHGGRFLPCGPGGAIRYVGGETRVLVVPRDVSFRELAAKLGEMAGGAKIVYTVRYRLVDYDDVLVSVTCDEELAHMRDEYDRLRTTRPSERFRVFFTGVQRRTASGLPPLSPKMLRAQSEQALAARAHMHQYAAGHAAGPAPIRRAQSAHELAGCSRFQPCCYDRRHQCYCSCHRHRDHYTPLPPMPQPVPPISKKVQGARPPGQEAAPEVSPAKPATGRLIFTDAATSKNSHGARPAGQEPSTAVDRRAFWEFE